MHHPNVRYRRSTILGYYKKTMAPCKKVMSAVHRLAASPIIGVRYFANLVRKLHNCSNCESIHCLDVYTRSLFMIIVQRPSETASF